MERGRMTVGVPGRPALTERQAAILSQIARYVEATGEPAPVAFVARQFGMTHKGAAHHVEALHAKGYLDRAGSPVRPQ
jgi:SOS-response transcriptional repressor LexA